MPESKEKISTNLQEAKTEIVDIRPSIDKETVPREIKSWMEKVEQASSFQPQQINDPVGQPLLNPVSPQDPKIVLPVTRKTFIGGFKKTWSDAGLWLSVFLLRFIKTKKGNVIFKTDDTN